MKKKEKNKDNMFQEFQEHKFEDIDILAEIEKLIQKKNKELKQQLKQQKRKLLKNARKRKRDKEEKGDNN